MGLKKIGFFNASNAFSHKFRPLGESRRFSPIFSIKYSSHSYEEAENERKREMTEKVKESMHNRTKQTGGLEEMKGQDSTIKGKESMMEGWVDDNHEDEEELGKKLAKDPGVGGKPLDEDQGLDVNWRPFDENKS